MGYRYIKQPNGKLACFSSFVDNIVCYNMTEDEAIEYGIDHVDVGRRTAKEMVERALADDMTRSHSVAARSPDGLNRWREALSTIALIHGPKARDEVVALVTTPETQEEP